MSFDKLAALYVYCMIDSAIASIEADEWEYASTIYHQLEQRWGGL